MTKKMKIKKKYMGFLQKLGPKQKHGIILTSAMGTRNGKSITSYKFNCS